MSDEFVGAPIPLSSASFCDATFFDGVWSFGDAGPFGVAGSSDSVAWIGDVASAGDAGSVDAGSFDERFKIRFSDTILTLKCSFF